ncbi:hypothetical protein BCR36DRAFT_587211 [Piromyces finnis]|uniref:Coth-domain-containing protein n=1 Tax=Piromyces finnis TaxID=1754191 RepID=A0A1Y1UWE8_9FUNG|nr:hypothetical protein BCR36DRAFT_587211 [Piromyces finnis]|eukprot:ORX42391.1 hypothetical protein BCR36DRAFT_587211 [Piromyces finnis]
MNCLLFSSILLFSLIGNIYGRVVTFSLIAFGNQVTVTFNGQTKNLTPLDNYSRVYQVSAECPDEEFEYIYTVDGVSEQFIRRLPKDEKSTHNEFFGRELTVSPLKGLGYPEDKPMWTRTIGKTPLFDDSYIPTVIIDDNSRDYFITGNDTYTIGRFTIVLKNEIFTETNVPSKAQNRYQDKFQWRIKLENKLYKRKVFKFRSNPNDPVFYRQQLYADVLSAIGNPVHNQIVVRAYLYDGTPLGLYLMIEVSNSNSFIKSQFYGNRETHKISVPESGLGAPIDCNMGADFTLGGPYNEFYAQEGQSNEKIPFLIEAMHALDVNDEAAVKKFSKEWFDLDIFLKAMAMEYLTGHWDSYWMYNTNYVLYDDPTESTPSTYKYYFIDQDFDLTFGISLSHYINVWEDEFPLQSYKTLVDMVWNTGDYEKPNREAIDMFLKGGVTTTMFENHLIDIVKHVFNPVALGRRVDEYVRRYSSEIEWDYSIERLHIATDPIKERYVWNINDYYENLDSTPKSTCRWGLRQYITMRAEAVAKEFGFEWDKVPLEPKYVEIYNTKEDYKPSKDSDKESGSVTIQGMNSTLIFITLITILFGFFL